MLSRTLLLFFSAACYGHAVLPIVVPAVHHTPLTVPYQPYGLHGLDGHGLLNHGWVHKPVHHVLKRSPRIIPLDHDVQLDDHLGHVSPVAHIAPVAVSHQSRVDVHTSPAVVAAPVIPVVKSIAVPLLHKSFLAAPYHFGTGHYGNSASPHHHFGHY